jgi:hypothetical protein
MKRINLLLSMLCFFSLLSIAQQNYEDVVLLKNGSIIRGTIIEQIPNQNLKIKTKDGSVFVYKISEVEKMTKEQIANASGNIGNNNYSGNQNVNIVIPSYKQIKMNYNPHMYISQPGDPYNPTVSGLCSWVIPGLGQMLSGETGRGLGFLGGYIGCSILTGVGSGIVTASYYDGGIAAGSLIMIVGIIGMATVDIWSIVDAVHVAKVKDMYVGDMRSKTSSLKLEVSPYVDQISMHNEIVRPLGMTMRVKF